MSEITPADAKKASLVTWGLLLAILGIGFYLRWVQVTSRSMWFDELFTLEISDRATWAEVYAKGVVPDVHPPLYAFLIWVLTRVIGTGMWVVRGPSVVAGLGATLATFFATRKWVGNRGALLASALMAFADAPVHFSSEARQGGFTPLLGVLLFWAWNEWALALSEKHVPSWKTVVGFAVAAVLLIYTAYVGMLLALSAVVTLWFFNRKYGVGKKEMLLTAAVILGSFIPWVLVFIRHLNTPFWRTDPPRPLHDALHFVEFLFSTDIGCFPLLFALLVIGLMPSRLFGPSSARNLRVFITLCLVWVVAPFALLTLKCIFFRPTLVMHGLLLSLGGAYALAGLGLAKALEVTGRRRMVLTLGVVFCLASHFPESGPEQWQESMAFLAAHDKGVPIVAYSCPENLFHKSTDDQRYFFDYYLKQAGSPRLVDLIAGEEQDWPKMVAFLGTQPGTVFWYADAHQDPSPKFSAHLNRSMQVLDHHQFRNVGLWKFRWLGVR